MEKTKNTQKDPDIITTFCNAAYNGMIVAVKNMLPALVMAYVFMLFLNITNLMSVIEFIFKPIMGLFGLPGAAAASLFMGYLTSSGALGIAASLYLAGTINASQVAIIVVGIFCLDSTVQYIGRVLGTSGIKSKYYPMLMLTNVFNAVVGMLIMRVILLVL